MVNPTAEQERQVPRRSVLKTLGAAFGVALVGGVGGRADAGVAAEASAEPAIGAARLAVVEGARGTTVTARIESSGERVDLKAADFPADWEFKVGDRVTVLDGQGTAGSVILPLVVTTSAAHPDFVSHDTASLGNADVAVTNQTVRDAIRQAAREPDPRGYHGLLVENVRTNTFTAFGIVGHH